MEKKTYAQNTHNGFISCEEISKMCGHKSWSYTVDTCVWAHLSCKGLEVNIQKNILIHTARGCAWAKLLSTATSIIFEKINSKYEGSNKLQIIWQQQKANMALLIYYNGYSFHEGRYVIVLFLTAKCIIQIHFSLFISLKHFNEGDA